MESSSSELAEEPSTVVTIAGWCIALNLPAEYQPLVAAPPYRAFLADGARVDARLVLRQVAKSDLSPGWMNGARARGRPFTEHPILNCEAVTRRFLSRPADELFVVQRRMLDFLRPDTWTMESYAFPTTDTRQQLRWTLARLVGSLLAAHRGVLLHGSGFVLDGAAGAVIGPSESGKTTAARLVRGDRLLSDDMVAVTDVDAQPRLHATPLGREADDAGPAPLRALFFPSKQAGFSLRKMAPWEAAAWAVAGQGEYLGTLFKPHMGAAIKNIVRLTKEVPVYELGFSLDGIDREAIRRVLTGS